MNDAIQVSKAQVPAYLQTSPFLHSWDDSDEPVSISAAVLKLDDTVTSSKQLDHLLMSLRYWIVSDLPFSVFEYVLGGTGVPKSNMETLWMNITLMWFERDLPSVACLLKMLRVPVLHRGMVALQAGDVNCVRYMFENGLIDLTTDCCSIAAGAGSVSCLQYLRSKKCAWSSDACTAAAVKGHLHCLKYLHEQRCRWTLEACNLAAQNGHLECLKYLHEQGCHWNSNACNFAAQNGHLECLMYLHQQGCKWNWKVCDACARNGHADCLQYAMEHGCPWRQSAVYVAAANGHVDVLCVIDLTHRARHCMRNVADEAARHGQIEVLQYLRAIGCNLLSSTCAFAAARGHLACLQFLHETGCAWYEYTTTWAASNGHLDCVKYAIENGCECTYFAYTVSKTEEIKNYIAAHLGEECIQTKGEHGANPSKRSKIAC